MHSESKNLITGVGSGLGKYLYETLPNSLGFTRTNCNEVLSSLQKRGVDTIIHCAYNKNNTDLCGLYEDNLKLTERLCRIPHKHFIYISTIDVYSSQITPYNLLKKMSEEIVLRDCNNPLILRLSALLGEQMKKNNILKVVDDANPSLSLTEDSTYSLISYSHVKKVVYESIHKGLIGKYDVVAKSLIDMRNIVKICEKTQDVSYGKYQYLTQELQGGIIERVLGLNHTHSIDVLRGFMRERNG